MLTDHAQFVKNQSKLRVGVYCLSSGCEELLTIYWTGYSVCTRKHEARSFCQPELARAVHKSEGFVFPSKDQGTWSVNSSLYVIAISCLKKLSGPRCGPKTFFTPLLRGPGKFLEFKALDWLKMPSFQTCQIL